MGRLNALSPRLQMGNGFLTGVVRPGGGVTNGLGNCHTLILQVYALLRPGGISLYSPLASAGNPDAAPDHRNDNERRPKTITAMSAQPWQG